MKITINGVGCMWGQVTISYEQIVSIAHPKNMRNDYSVMFQVPRGPSGVLSTGRSAIVYEGMTISCMATGSA